MYENEIASMERRAIQIPDFSAGLQWFNSAPLSFKKELKGKIVLLDFWTYCCINCMHVLPDLAFLEKKYAGAPVAFIGVHSAKFDNEKDPENIRSAILRYDIEHPVVNDPEMSLWQKLGVHSWPSYVIVGPTGNILMLVSGEGMRNVLDSFIREALENYEPSYLDAKPLPISLEKKKISKDLTLSFPGKLAIDAENQRLFISDSNHHRILVTTLEGKILDIIGAGYPGLVDGSYQTARFNRLQGLAYDQDKLYVADAENHALRMVDLVKKEVQTLAGNGSQGRDHRGGGIGKDQALSTPWDVAMDLKNKRLFIAMAGTHQIWVYELSNGRARAFSGSGSEQNLNSNNLLHAAWAQPSGLSLSEDFLFVADSESSSIRAIDLKNQKTVTFAGGDAKNPSNLFEFGDREGKPLQARFQHPLGVLWLEKEGLLLVADTYNHRIKTLDPKTGVVANVAGNGKPGDREGIGMEAQFSEPSGFALSPDGENVYIADTNNHKIKILNLKTNRVSSLAVK